MSEITEEIIEEYINAEETPAVKPQKPLTVLLCAAECAPFAKTGGLADVIGALSKELRRQGIDARVLMPCHRVIKENYGESLRHLTSFSVPLCGQEQYVGVETLKRDGVTFYFIDNEMYFGDSIYRWGDGGVEQYAFFSRAAVECMRQIDFIPQVLHVHDWHAALIPFLLKTQYEGIGEVKTLLSIHNLSYQGRCDFNLLSSLLGIDSRYYTPEFIETYGCANFLKAGCVFSDALSTVSPSYALEIQGEYYGEGLDGILRARSHQLTGILNGLDTDIFNPQKDTCLPLNYSAQNMKNKALLKEKLAEELGLILGEDTPIVAMIGRLTRQKGLDLVINRLDAIMEKDVALVILGQGDSDYENFLRDAENRYKGRVCSYIGYNEEVAHRIYAGADFLLMPSLFEPCGLSQMIAQRYGTLPIVRETGGLRDSVVPYNCQTGEGDGFSFANFNAHEMEGVLSYALEVYRNKKALAALQKNAMKRELSFRASTVKYIELYKSLV